MQPESKRTTSFCHWCAGVVFLLTLGTAPAAWALDDSDKEAIRLLSNEAAAEFERGQFESARDKFARAYAIANVPKLAVWVARANERLGKFVNAYEYYRQALGLERNELWMGDIQAQAQADAERALETLTPRLAKIIVLVEGAAAEDVKVTLDGVTIPAALLGIERFVDPGQREITGTRGPTKVSQVATLDEGGKTTVVLKFDAQAAAPLAASTASTRVVSEQSRTDVRFDTVPTNSQRTWGWVGLGVGGAGLLTGAVSGLLVMSKYSDLQEDCPKLHCTAKYDDRVDSYRTVRTVSTVGFLVGGVSAAVGVTLLLTSPGAGASQSAQRLGLWVTPEMASLVGSF